MSTIVIATIKSWNIQNAENLKQEYPEYDIKIIAKKEELTKERLDEWEPRYVFFPHWSWIIPKDIYSNFECVVFHMTDLPFGRGGSPLQNLLLRGIYDTKVSAIKVSAGVDTGPVYLKEPLDISRGNADEILQMVSDIIFNKMIPRFLKGNLVPQVQTGDPVIFKRRTPEQSKIPDNLSPRQIFDYIRMLDGEGYPLAYIESGGGKVCFRRARYIDGVVYADAEFKGGE